MRYKTTSKGTQLPDRWVLPEALRDDTGVIFASAFPGYDAFVADLTRYYADRARREAAGDAREPARPTRAVEQRPRRRCWPRSTAASTSCGPRSSKNPYAFDRRFLFRVLSMGHSQFAELIGARGPNTQINAACASTHAGRRAGRGLDPRRALPPRHHRRRRRRHQRPTCWSGSAPASSPAARRPPTTSSRRRRIPFDRRRHGMILGMGAAAMVVESAEAARERGIRPICEVLSAVTANSAFHGTRLDVEHICQVMETLVAQAEARWGIERQQIAPQTVFVSHETYTPARGGSAAAEVHALRHVFGAAADQIVVANTKGFTGHPMGVGIEDVVAVKALETGLVPPVANFKEVDPELGPLNLSKGGALPGPVRAAAGRRLRLADQHDAAALGADADGTRPDARRARVTPTGSPTPTPGRRGSAASAATPGAELEVVQRTLRVKDQGPGGSALRGPSQPAPPADGRASQRRLRVPAAAPTASAAEPAAGLPLPAADATDGCVKERVLALVAEKTGYPPDMLDLDLDLEADLGIDTVKQAEMFAAIREAYDIPRDDKLKLRDFPTLAHVIQFVHDRRPDLAAAAASAAGRERRPAAAGRAAPAASACRRMRCRSACSRWSRRRPAIRPTCSTSISISKPTSASTR